MGRAAARSRPTSCSLLLGAPASAGEEEEEEEEEEQEEEKLICRYYREAQGACG
jgi:hypothetical protein